MVYQNIITKDYIGSKNNTIMRFTKQKELREAYFKYTLKQKTKFLWFPLTIDGETRWLETATIEYKSCRARDILLSTVYYWEPWNFINK